MKWQRPQPRIAPHRLRSVARICTSALLVLHPWSAIAQTQAATPAPAASTSNNQNQEQPTNDSHTPTGSEKRRAASLYMTASKLFVDSQFESALRDYERAAKLDPTNNDYKLSAEVARSHAVTALIQSAARARLTGDDVTARADLAHALELDPKSAEASQHLFELGDDAVRGASEPLYERAGSQLADVDTLAPSAGLHSFHLRSDQLSLIRQVFQAYGITAMLDQSVSATQVQFDVDDASFDEAMRVLSLATKTFYVPLDAHRALVAQDTRALRQQYTRLELETISTPGLSDADLTELTNVAKNVFDVQQVSIDHDSNAITLRASPSTLAAFNETMRALLAGRNQVLLDVRMIQVAHSSTRNTGVQPPQTITAFNVYAEEQSILSQNASLVQEIISSGLASPGDTLAILGILLASGQVSSSIFSNGLALFGGGLTASGLSPSPATLNLNLNTSDSRELDQIQLRLGDDETGTIKEGERYPIQTSSYSSLSSGASSIAGLTAAGTSSSLSSLVSSLSSTVPNIPMVQYQDLGLTLKATPKVMRSDAIALTLDLTLTALSGSSLNGNPILNNQSYSAVATLKEDEATVVAAELSQSQIRAISGTPGLSEIPGLNNATNNNVQSNYSTLVIVITPHVVRGTQPTGHTPMMQVSNGPA